MFRFLRFDRFMKFSENYNLTEVYYFDKQTNLYRGDVAQLGERGVRNAEVRGSIPLISTIYLNSFCCH